MNYAIRFSVAASGMAPPRRLHHYKSASLARLPFLFPRFGRLLLPLIAVADHTSSPCRNASQGMRCAIAVVSLFPFLITDAHLIAHLIGGSISIAACYD